MLYNILLIVQIIVSVSIIGLVLIQHGKGADAGAAFGSGSSGTVFGSRGAGNFLSRTTGILAAIFFANSLALAWIVAHRPETTSLVDSMATTEQVSTPAAATESQGADTSAKPTASADEIPADTDTGEKVKQTGKTDSPADDIPADTGDAAKTAPKPDNKGSDIPE